MYHLLLTILNRDYRTPDYNPYQGLLMHLAKKHAGRLIGFGWSKAKAQGSELVGVGELVGVQGDGFRV